MFNDVEFVNSLFRGMGLEEPWPHQIHALGMEGDRRGRNQCSLKYEYNDVYERTKLRFESIPMPKPPRPVYAPWPTYAEASHAERLRAFDPHDFVVWRDSWGCGSASPDDGRGGMFVVKDEEKEEQITAWLGGLGPARKPLATMYVDPEWATAEENFEREWAVFLAILIDDLADGLDSDADDDNDKDEEILQIIEGVTATMDWYTFE